MYRLPINVLCAACVIAAVACEKKPDAPQAAPSPVAAMASTTQTAPAPNAVTGAQADGEKPTAAVCDHAKNPTCATDLDPNVVAMHGPALQLDGDKYGQGVTLAVAVKMSELAANPEKFAGQRVRVEGEVADVCKMRGCWFSMKSDEAGKTMKFKVTDGLMVFPTNAVGKYAVAEGMVKKMVLDLETTKQMLAHEAEEQGKPFDAASVTEPITMVRIDGIGAVIRDKK